jgi:hypothetical protein
LQSPPPCPTSAKADLARRSRQTGGFVGSSPSSRPTSLPSSRPQPMPAPAMPAPTGQAGSSRPRWTQHQVWPRLDLMPPRLPRWGRRPVAGRPPAGAMLPPAVAAPIAGRAWRMPEKDSCPYECINHAKRILAQFRGILAA